MTTNVNALNAHVSTYGVLVGGANASITSIAPSAAALIPGIFTSAGASSNPSFTAPSAITFSVNYKVITATGTYTPTSGMVYCKIEIIGPGGGGGGSSGSSATKINGGAAGGGGEYACGIFSAATIGASQSCTIGAVGTAGSSAGSSGGNGGTSSVGALITAGGGKGGAGSAAGVTSIATAGGAGGSGGTGGDYRMAGGPGQATWGFYISSSQLFVRSDMTGPGYFGTSNVGGSPSYTSTRPSGLIPLNYGAGGGAGVEGNTTNTAAGAAGSASVILITEYI